MKSSSIKLAKTLGIESPKEYRDTLIHEWFIAKEFADRLEVYILRRLESAILFELIKDGEIILGKHTYSVIWLTRPSTARKAEFVLLSLRFCPILKCGYALVKTVVGESTIELLDTTLIQNLLHRNPANDN